MSVQGIVVEYESIEEHHVNPMAPPDKKKSYFMKEGGIFLLEDAAGCWYNKHHWPGEEDYFNELSQGYYWVHTLSGHRYSVTREAYEIVADYLRRKNK